VVIRFIFFPGDHPFVITFKEIVLLTNSMALLLNGYQANAPAWR